MAWIITPLIAAGPPASKLTIWQARSQITSVPGSQWTRSAISLHIVPVGSSTAASLPVSSATCRQSALVVGSSPFCSSPTAAVTMASNMAGVGFERVSLWKSA